MSEQYFAGVDVGSASVRAGIFANDGTRVGFATRPITQFHPKANFVEQSSREIWQMICEAMNEAVASSGIAKDQIISLGFDATCSLVAIDQNGQGVSISESGEPERDIIMWMDHRATAEASEINKTGDEALRYVGGEVSVEMELPKVLWLKRNLPERYKTIWRLFDLADFLVWKATDSDSASVCTLTCKWNYLAHENRFSQSLLQAVKLDDLTEKVPPAILRLGEKAGKLSAQAAEALGLSTDVIVASGIIDAHAGGLALVGSSPEQSLALISGTSNCHMVVSREPVMVPGVWGPYWDAMLPDWWLNEGGQSAAGALVEWAVRQNASWPELQNEAEKSGKNPFAVLNEWVADLELREELPTRHLHVLGDHHGNRSPRANPHAKGAVYGLTLEQGRDALARIYLATLQAVAYGTRHIIETIHQAGSEITSLKVCGGATKNPLWLREYADITGCDLHLARDEDVVTLGAALLGAVACDGFSSLPDAAVSMVGIGKTVKANPDKKAFHDAKYKVYLQMYDDQQRAQKEMQTFL
ncbi:FGGY-family carbohydrate kinase [Microvirga sp. W0021]|uniref:FGGY-family carbohydrate kinase n=1 Tax=Hohaiivirga grylli TaxID=3133970 RepID=A0ABV0BFW0_9HYPH